MCMRLWIQSLYADFILRWTPCTYKNGHNKQCHPTYHTQSHFPIFSFADTSLLHSTHSSYLRYVPLLIPSFFFSLLSFSLFLFYEPWTLLWSLFKWNSLSRCRVIAIVLERFKLQIRGYFCGNRQSPGVSVGCLSRRPLGIIGCYFVLNSLPDGFLLNDFHTFCSSCHWIFNVSRRTSCSSAFKLNVSIRVTSGAVTIEHNGEWVKIYQQVNYIPLCQLQVLAHYNAKMPALWRETHVSRRTAVELGDWLTSNLSGESHMAMRGGWRGWERLNSELSYVGLPNGNGENYI